MGEAPGPAYQARYDRVDSAIRALHSAMFERDMGRGDFAGGVDLAFRCLVDALGMLDELMADEPRRAEGASMFRHTRRFIIAFRLAADLWLHPKTREASTSITMLGISEWNAAIDEGDRLARAGW